MRQWPVGHFRHPPDVTAVRDAQGRLWVRGTTRWTLAPAMPPGHKGSTWVRWYHLTAQHGPLTEEPQPNRRKE